MTASTTTRQRVVTPAAIVRMAIAWAAVGGLALAHPLLAAPVPAPLLIGTLVLIIAVVLIAAFGVVHEAEALAHRLGDPYGSLVLTLSIVLIEVILISAVMLGPGEHATIARDSVTAVMMIILNLVIGVSLLVSGIRNGARHTNRVGTSAYLGMIAVLVVFAFVLPTAIGADGSYTPGQAVPIIAATILLYGFFLWRQAGVQAPEFQEPDAGPTAADQDPAPSIGTIIREHRTEILTRVAVLVVTVIPIVLLSHDLAGLLDDGLGRLGAPPALAGVLIACIVFAPETITTIRAAIGAEIQRVVNLCLGAFVSTVGLTIPAVLTIGLLTGQQVILAETPAMLALVIASVVLSVITFTAPKVTAMHGAMHLALFAVYGVILFS